MKRKIQDCLAYRLFLLLPLFSFGGCVEIKAPVDYVNPYMGNISHLLVPTYPTVHLPNSMLRIYPQREDYTSNKLKGLPVIVTSHRGNSAFSINPFNSFCDSLEKGSRSSFILYNYDNEKIKPYYYSVFLSDYDIGKICPFSSVGFISIRFPDRATWAFDRGDKWRVACREKQSFWLSANRFL